MRTKFVLLFFLYFSFQCISASDDITNEREHVVLSGSSVPRPHMIDLSEPVAMYTISTATLDITFDTTYYSEYTIHLVGDYVEMDYFVYTPVVYIPVASFGDIVEIYIESEDCGSYYGICE